MANTLISSADASILTLILDKLNGIGGAQGPPKEESERARIIKEQTVNGAGSTLNPGTKVNPVLTSDEHRRTYSTAWDMAKAFFDFNQKSKGDVSKPKNITSAAKDTVSKGSAPSMMSKVNKQNIGFLADLILAIGLVSALVWKYFGAMGGFAMKSILKLPTIMKDIFMGLKAIIPSMEGILKPLKTAFTTIKEFIFPATKIAKDVGTGTKSLTSTLKGVASATGKTLLSRLKIIPFLGALASFAFAYMRFKEGNWVRGIGEIASGLFNLTGGGWPISLMIDGAMLVYDLAETKGVGAAKQVSTGIKVGGKAIFKVLSKIATKVGLKLMTALKFLPVIGGLANIGLGFYRMQQGETIAGILEFVSGIADIAGVVTGGAGSAISWIIDGGLLIYDLMKTPKTAEEQKATGTGNADVGILATASNIIGNALYEKLWYIPGISGIMYLGRGLGLLAGGQYKEGLMDIFNSLTGFIGGKGLVSGFGYILGLFSGRSSAKNEIQQKKFTMGSFIVGMISDLWTYIKDTLSDFVGAAKDSIVEGAKNMVTLPAAAGIGAASSIISAPMDALASKRSLDASKDAYKDTAERIRIKTAEYNAARAQAVVQKQQVSVPQEVKQQVSVPQEVKQPQGQLNLDDQNRLIAAQTGVLVDSNITNKQILQVLKNQKPSSVVVNGGGATGATAAIQPSTSPFSTYKNDAQGMYRGSPYSLNVSPVMA